MMKNLVIVMIVLLIVFTGQVYLDVQSDRCLYFKPSDYYFVSYVNGEAVLTPGDTILYLTGYYNNLHIYIDGDVREAKRISLINNISYDDPLIISHDFIIENFTKYPGITSDEYYNHILYKKPVNIWDLVGNQGISDSLIDSGVIHRSILVDYSIFSNDMRSGPFTGYRNYFISFFESIFGFLKDLKDNFSG